MQCLESVLRVSKARQIVWDAEGDSGEDGEQEVDSKKKDRGKAPASQAAAEGGEQPPAKIIETCVFVSSYPIRGRTCIDPLERANSLVYLMKANPSPQMQYQLAFCFWLLSFDQKIAERINT